MLFLHESANLLSGSASSMHMQRTSYVGYVRCGDLHYSNLGLPE